MALERARLLHCPICFEVMILRDPEGDVWECPECGSMVKGPNTEFRTVGQLWNDEQRTKRRLAKPGGGGAGGRRRRRDKGNGKPVVVRDDPEFNRRHLEQLLEREGERERILNAPGLSAVPTEYLFPRGFLQYGRDEIDWMRARVQEMRREAAAKERAEREKRRQERARKEAAENDG